MTWIFPIQPRFSAHRRCPQNVAFAVLCPHIAVLWVYFDVLCVYFEVVYSGRPTMFKGTACGLRRAHKPQETKRLRTTIHPTETPQNWPKRPELLPSLYNRDASLYNRDAHKSLLAGEAL